MNVTLNVNILYALTKYFLYSDTEIIEIRILNEDNVKLYTTNGIFMFHYDYSNENNVEILSHSDSIIIDGNTRFTEV